MNNSAAHSKLVDDLLLAVGGLTDVRLWLRPVGFDEGRRISYGIKGEADLQGIVSPSGRMLAIECKTGSGKLSKDQKNWRVMFEKFGGLYILARSVHQVLDELRAAGVRSLVR